LRRLRSSTTDPNDLVEPLHNRMPVILQPKDYDRWLRPGDPEQLPVDLLRPFPAEQMTAWKVDRKVGNVRNDTPDCIEPMTEEEPRTPSLFQVFDAATVVRDTRGE
jgi:putative SOS response-associated peptidase YedK